MAESSNTPPRDTTTVAALAARLIDHADGITDVTHHEMEADLRAAAALLKEQDGTTPPLVPRLVSELRGIATFSADLDMKRKLRALLGDYA